MSNIVRTPDAEAVLLAAAPLVAVRLSRTVGTFLASLRLLLLLFFLLAVAAVAAVVAAAAAAVVVVVVAAAAVALVWLLLF